MQRFAIHIVIIKTLRRQKMLQKTKNDATRIRLPVFLYMDRYETKKRLNMTDDALLARLRNGDSRALDAIMVRYGAYVQTIAANITIPPLQPEDVEEVASDVFLSLWRRADDIGDGKLKAWLAAVTRNAAKNKLRKNHLELPLEDDYFVLDVPDTERLMLEQELQLLTRQAVAALPEPDRMIFIRYYFFYQKTAEIAEAMELNASTVRSKLLRGREALRRYLNERGYGVEAASF